MERLGREQLVFIFLAASPLVLARFAREIRGFAARAPGSTTDRHATQAIICSAPVADLCLSDDASMLCTLSQARLSLVMLLRRYHIAS